MTEPIDPVVVTGDFLKVDGERFLPGVMHGAIAVEHLHRYCFASNIVVRKVVLDIASGEGYGSAYLADFAEQVIGVDISDDAINHARSQYVRGNLEFLKGSCSAIPLEDGVVDVVVSFETIEHHSEHEVMMREIKRVLRPDGLLIISSPDKLEYSDKPAYRNPFHVRELYVAEFQALLSSNFRNVKLFGQRVSLHSMLLSQEDLQRKIYGGACGQAADGYAADPKYWVALASDHNLPVVIDRAFDQPIPKNWEYVVSEAQNDKKTITQLIKSIAVSDSSVLKSHLRASWYASQYPDVVEAGVDPYDHWIVSGVAEGRFPSAHIFELVKELLVEREQALRSTIEKTDGGLGDATVSAIDGTGVLPTDL